MPAWKSGHRDTEGKTPRGEKPATGLEGRECGARSPGTRRFRLLGEGAGRTLPWSFWGKQDPPNLDFRLPACRARR